MFVNPFVNILLVIVVLAGQIHCYPNGINVDSACITLKPDHGGVDPRTSTPSYKLTFSPTTYAPGKPITVNLASCTTTGYMGFMLQARRADQSKDQTSPIGNFTLAANSRQACSNQALVHSNKDSKTAQTFIWNPPTLAAGHLQFRVTFVQSQYTFWTNVFSDILYDESLNASTTTNNLSPVTTLNAACSLVTTTTAKSTVVSTSSPTATTKSALSSTSLPTGLLTSLKTSTITTYKMVSSSPPIKQSEISFNKSASSCHGMTSFIIWRSCLVFLIYILVKVETQRTY